MTIKQNGGVFGRNPTFNNVTIDGDLTVEGAVVHDGDLTVDNINLSNNTISTTNTNGDLLLDPNGTGKVGVNELSPDRTFSVTAAAVIPVRFESTGRDNQLEFANSVGTPKIGSFDDNFLILTGGSETVRVDSSGHLIVPAGITLGTATGVHTTAKTLDDYEEGVFTVALAPSTSGTITINSSYQTLYYTKIGRVVYITGQIRVSAVSSPVGVVNITNLPFANSSASQTPDTNFVTTQVIGAAADPQSYSGYIFANSSTIILYKNGNQTSAADFSGNEYISISGFYCAAT